MSTCSYSSSNVILDYLDENKFFSFLTTTTFVIIGTFIYIVSLYRYFEKERIPRIAQPSAPYGNIKDVIDKDTTLYELITKYYNKLRKKQLKCGGMYLFFKPGLVIADSALIREILLNQELFSDVRKEKKHLLPILISIEVIDDFLTNSWKIIRKDFVDCLKENPSHFEDLLHDFVINSMCVIFGLEKNEVVLNLIDIEENKATSSSFRYYLNIICSYFKQNIHDDWRTVVDNNKLNRKKHDIKKKDILQSFIEYTPDDTLLTAFINNFIENIIFSYHSILFCLYELSRNNDIQDELIGEIRRFNISDRNINDLPYLEAIVKETLRIYPPVPLIIRKCQRNYESCVTDIKLKNGNLVLIPTSALHHDPSIYVDPKNFDPDRFLEDDIEKVSTFLPFGTVINDHEERHKEFHISIIVIKAMLVSIFSSFKVKLNDDDYYLRFDSTKINMQPEKPLPIKLEKLE